MNPWLETSAVIALLVTAAAIGFWFSRLPKYHWLWGYFIPLALLLLLDFASHHPMVLLTPPVSWIMMGRRKFALVGVIAVILLTTPMPRLPKRRLRVMVAALLGVYILFESVLPFAAPIFNKTELAAMTTRIDNDGICRQSAGYTCGPASAVTALRLLGLPAEEGPIAILSRHVGIRRHPAGPSCRDITEPVRKVGPRCRMPRVSRCGGAKECWANPCRHELWTDGRSLCDSASSDEFSRHRGRPFEWPPVIVP